MLHELLSTTDPLIGILISMIVGVVLVLGAAMLFFRIGHKPVRWRALFIAVAVALGLTVVGLGLNCFAAPGSYGGSGMVISVITMPGVVAAMNIFGSYEFDRLPFFGGYAFNILVLSGCAYAALRRFQRA